MQGFLKVKNWKLNILGSVGIIKWTLVYPKNGILAVKKYEWQYLWGILFIGQKDLQNILIPHMYKTHTQTTQNMYVYAYSKMHS